MTLSLGALLLLLMLAFWGALFAYGRSFLSARADLHTAARQLIGTAFLIGILLPFASRAGHEPSSGFAGVIGSGFSFAAPMLVAALMERRRRKRGGFTVSEAVRDQTPKAYAPPVAGAGLSYPNPMFRRAYAGFGLLLLALAYWVWPTPYSYMDAHLWGPDPVKVRTNRFTGKMDVLVAGYGWNSDLLQGSPPAAVPVVTADTVTDPVSKYYGLGSRAEDLRVKDRSAEFVIHDSRRAPDTLPHR